MRAYIRPTGKPPTPPPSPEPKRRGRPPGSKSQPSPAAARDPAPERVAKGGGLEARIDGGIDDVTKLTVSRPEIRHMRVTLIGDAPLVINAFPQKAMQLMIDTQAKGSQGKKGRARVAKDFEAVFNGARHLSDAGWDGVPAASIRNAMIAACRVTGFAMTIAKMSVFCKADGYDVNDASGLVRIIGHAPTMNVSSVRNATGVVDVRPRPIWRNWAIQPIIKFDAGQFSEEDVLNLLQRAGQQVGIGEGRPFSKQSAGVGWGTFYVADDAENIAVTSGAWLKRQPVPFVSTRFSIPTVNEESLIDDAEDAE